MSSSRPIDNPKDPRTDEKPVFSKELVQEDLWFINYDISSFSCSFFINSISK
ncbi:hypothetical protein [Coprococcus comes]|uniref:hypothetical protein n=1 Tax=Coprococcus comes TaxID=410072 RepID=UPI00189A4771|nr:hypothetical protein [Coprococcus comes]